MAISKRACFAVSGVVVFLVIALILALIPVYMRSRRAHPITVVIDKITITSITTSSTLTTVIITTTTTSITTNEDLENTTSIMTMIEETAATVLSNQTTHPTTISRASTVITSKPKITTDLSNRESPTNAMIRMTTDHKDLHERSTMKTIESVTTIEPIQTNTQDQIKTRITYIDPENITIATTTKASEMSENITTSIKLSSSADMKINTESLEQITSNVNEISYLTKSISILTTSATVLLVSNINSETTEQITSSIDTQQNTTSITDEISNSTIST